MLQAIGKAYKTAVRAVFGVLTFAVLITLALLTGVIVTVGSALVSPTAAWVSLRSDIREVPHLVTDLWEQVWDHVKSVG